MTEFLRDIHLHGSLGEQFGRLHQMAVDTTAEAVRALASQFPGFRRAIEIGTWKIIHGRPEVGAELGEAELLLSLGRHPLHIVPVVLGAGLGETLGKIVAGLALASVAFIPGIGATVIGAAVANAAVGLGLSLVAGGVSSLITSKPNSANGRSGVDERASFIFQGAENVSAQGGAVPLVFGRMLVGSVVVSAGLAAEQA